LIARGLQAVERERIICGSGRLLFQQAAEHAAFGEVELNFGEMVRSFRHGRDRDTRAKPFPPIFFHVRSPRQAEAIQTLADLEAEVAGSIEVSQTRRTKLSAEELAAAEAAILAARERRLRNRHALPCPRITGMLVWQCRAIPRISTFPT
jgi:hypothetical protein